MFFRAIYLFKNKIFVKSVLSEKLFYRKTPYLFGTLPFMIQLFMIACQSFSLPELLFPILSRASPFNFHKHIKTGTFFVRLWQFLLTFLLFAIISKRNPVFLTVQNDIRDIPFGL